MIELREMTDQEWQAAVEDAARRGPQWAIIVDGNLIGVAMSVGSAFTLHEQITWVGGVMYQAGQGGRDGDSQLDRIVTIQDRA